MKKVTKISLVAFGVLFVLAAFAYTAFNKTVRTDHGESSLWFGVEDGWETVKTVNTRFDVQEVPTLEGSLTTISVRQTVHQEIKFGMEGSRATVEVEMTPIPSSNGQFKAWKLITEGDVGRIAAPFYEVTKYGCCDSPNSIGYFSLESGKSLYVSVVPIREIDLLNGQYPCCRYVSAGYKNHDYQRAYVQYGTSEKVLSEFEMSGLKEVVADITIVQADKKQYPERVMVDASKLFEIQVTFRDGTVLVFPVVNSLIQKPKTSPAGVTVTATLGENIK